MSPRHMQLCETCGVPVDVCGFEGQHPPDPMVTASDQIVGALSDLDRHADTYLRWPWVELDRLYGGMAPGTVHYPVGFSGMGKSTFISSAILRWAEQGRRVEVMPLEIAPNVFRTYLACQQVGIDPGLMLSGDFWRLPNADALRQTVKAKVMEQVQRPFVDRVYVHGVSTVTVQAVERAAHHAVQRGADVLVIDHIDHIEGDRDRARSLYEQSVQVQKAVLRLAQETGLIVIAMSQANQQALSNTTDKLAKYAPPMDNHVLNGGEKRRNATGMLGLFRPLLPPPEGGDEEDYKAWKQTIAKARSGEEPPHTALEPHTMGISLMKSRNYGGREGQRVSLTWQEGRIVDRVHLSYALRVA